MNTDLSWSARRPVYVDGRVTPYEIHTSREAFSFQCIGGWARSGFQDRTAVRMAAHPLTPALSPLFRAGLSHMADEIE